jgi:agmatinase
MQQPAFEYLRHGQTPFFRLPGSPDADVSDVSIVGVPHDGGTTYQPGARLGPYHVRRVSALVQGYHPELGADVFAKLRCVDGGNVVFPPFDRAAMREAVEAEVKQLAMAKTTPILVGGDHSITLPALRALAAHHGPLAIVHIDAHLDTSGPEIWGDDFHHGTPLRHALAEKLVADGMLFQIGIRGPGERSGAITADDVAERGAKRVAAELRERIGRRPTYVTIDIDAIDPAFAPGTGTPVPGGLTSREALALVRGLAGVDMIGGDVVELCPPLDHADITAHLCAHLIWELIAVRARV